LQDNFLAVPHGGGATGRSETAPVRYEWRYTPPTNTGLGSGMDLDNNGSIGGSGDAFGFGNFPGQYGFTIYSKYPIKSVRSFQNFLWKDMPGNLLTNDPAATVAANLGSFFAPEEIDALRLPSKNHVDVTIDINGTEVHFLAAHPTPPIATGPEARNAKHNHDEIRFWSDYVSGGDTAAYIYDDQGSSGGLASGAIFVIAGDYNADPNDGDSYEYSIRPLLQNPAVNTLTTPASEGGIGAATDPDNNGAANAKHVSDPRNDTADFSDAGPGNLRVDYVLPSANVSIKDSGVFWPAADAAERPLVGEFNQPDLFSGLPSSDHKAVYVDVVIP
jgi:3-phytase/alkaline phosphatase D